MLKFNKNNFEIFTGWLIVLMVMINVICPVAGIIAGVLFMSQNYLSLMIMCVAIIMAAYTLTLYQVMKEH